MNIMYNRATPLWFLGFSVLPVIVALMFHPLWQINGKTGITIVPILTMILNVIIVPVYLLVLFNHFAIRQNIGFAVGIPICILSAVGSIAIQYWNWGSVAETFWSPDAETVILIFFETLISMAILLVGMGIMICIKLRHR